MARVACVGLTLEASDIGRTEVTQDNTQALERFLGEVQKRAFRMAEIATGNREDALDIVQDAMCKLVQNYAVRDESEWGPLFQRILQSKIRDWYRRSKVRNRLRVWFGRKDEAEDEADAVGALADSHAPSLEQKVQSGQAMACLEQALGELPLRQQQVCMLRIWEGMDVAQTAQAMGCSQGSVKTHYSRAVHKLRELLGEHWP